MKAVKIRVKSPEHSEVIQKMLFAAGCGWVYGGKEARNTDEPFLFVDTLGRLTHCLGDDQYFLESPEPEVDFDWCIPEIPERETIEIGGVEYYADEVEARLRELNPVE